MVFVFNSSFSISHQMSFMFLQYRSICGYIGNHLSVLMGHMDLFTTLLYSYFGSGSLELVRTLIQLSLGFCQRGLGGLATSLPTLVEHRFRALCKATSQPGPSLEYWFRSPFSSIRCPTDDRLCVGTGSR